MKPRRKVLQIFNRYLEYGGEQGSVFRIGDTLQQVADVEYFTTSSEDLLGKRGIEDMAAAAAMSMHNPVITRRLARYQAVGRFDLWQIHNVFPAMSPSVYAAAFRRGIPVVQYLHNYRMSCTNGYFLNHGETCTSCIRGNFTKAAVTGCWRDSRAASGWMGLVLMRLRALGVFRKVSAWVALSRAQKDLHVRMGIPADRIHIVPHFFEPAEELRIAEPGRDVLFLGRLSKEKGASVLLDAWKAAETGQARLLLAGDGPEGDALRAKVAAEGIPRVEFLGFVSRDRQEELWRRAAFSVVPSIWQDPLPTVVFEAWERGRPAVVSDAGGLSDIVEQGVDGLKVPLGDAAELARAITRMLSDATVRTAMAEMGRLKLATHYSKDLWIGRINRVYDAILPP
ncbi:MAG: glycosyltransferase family 4 protein [Chthoniobacterales bacterium]|nr:glycosyltransferase family 4 protein [Chthoniobacterales bacterium]